MKPMMNTSNSTILVSCSNGCCRNSSLSEAEVEPKVLCNDGINVNYHHHHHVPLTVLSSSSSSSPRTSALTRSTTRTSNSSSTQEFRPTALVLGVLLLAMGTTTTTLGFHVGVSDAWTLYYHPKHQRSAIPPSFSTCNKKRARNPNVLYMDDERHSSSSSFSSSSSTTASIFHSNNIMVQSSSFLQTTSASVSITNTNNFDVAEALNYVKGTQAVDLAVAEEEEPTTTTTTASSVPLMVDSQPSTTSTWSDQLVSLGTTTNIKDMNNKDFTATTTTTTTTTKIRASVKETGIESMSIYLKTMGNHELLQAEEEVILAREIQKLCQYEEIRMALEYELLRPPTYAEWAKKIHPNMTVQSLKRQIRRSQRAKAALTESNLRLVISIARRYVNRGLNFQDLCQEGIFGLTKACEKFDPELGFRFSTYSTWWIKQGIMRAIADQGRTIRLPVHIHDQLNTIRKTEMELRDELGRTPTSTDIAEKLGITTQRVEFIKKKGANSVSMEAPVSNSGSAGAKGSKAGGGSTMDKETTVQDLVGDPAQRPMDEAFNQMFRDDMSRLISTLNSREQAVVRMRFGLDDGKAKTLEEIGKRFSVTRERIRQIEARALHKLRQPYRNYSVKCYVNDL